MTANKQLIEGNKTEKFVAKTLKKYGYWNYIIPKKINGQPCDVFAAKGGNKTIVWNIDAKHVEGGKVSFSFDRIEPNQHTSFAYAINFAHLDNCGFAIFFDRTKSLYWFPYKDYMKYAELGLKSINMNELRDFEEVLKDADSN